LVGCWASAGAAEPQTVRDRMWVWAHDAGVYNGHWGLPGNSRITPAEGAAYLSVPNVIFIRYEGRPKPPFSAYAPPFKGLKRVMWSVTGASGATSESERSEVLALAREMPNMTGVFMDDFFHFGAEAATQWLAANNPTFPVSLTVTLAAPATVDGVELVQSDWRTGDYVSRDFAVDLSGDGREFQQAAQGTMPAGRGASIAVAVPRTEVRAVRIRILNTHDKRGAMSCGLGRIRLKDGRTAAPLKEARAEASSEYAGFAARNALGVEAEAAAALSVEQLRQVRRQLALGDRRLDLGVTLYTHQLDPRIVPHLALCDVVSLWTWKAEDLDHLEDNFVRFERLAPGKRVLLGLYMWDFGANRPMPLERMKQQCQQALRWLGQGRMEGMIFLATNICDLKLETVEWTRRWINEVGDPPLPTQPH
jgi:hypothetical protein